MTAYRFYSNIGNFKSIDVILKIEDDSHLSI